MKTKISILLGLTLLLNFPLNAVEEVNYLVTDEDTFIGTNLNFGLSNAKLTQTDGQVAKIDKDLVESFFVTNKRFDKMPIYMNGKNTGKEDFMELISQRNGLRLYKFKCNQNLNVNDKDACLLIVFKEKDFYVQVDKNNAKTIAEFFHINEIVCN